MTGVLGAGLRRIRDELGVPVDFPPTVEDAAQRAAAKVPHGSHADRTEIPFVTLDPAA